MRTRSQSRNNFPQQEASPAIVEPLRIELPFLEDQFQEDPPEDPPEVQMADQFQEEPPEDPPEVSMADNRTMAELLQAPTEGYEDAIVILEIAANNFELKNGLINLVQNKQFFEHDKEDPHAHIPWIWLEKEAPQSILIWEDLVSKFINQFFPPSKTTNLRNEITRFQQRFDESFYEAWEHFNDLLRACPHHGFSELHQLDTFYNALNVNDHDSLNSAAGGNFLDKMPRECLKIIENKSKVRQTRSKAVVAKVSTSSSTPAISSDVAELKDMVRALLLDKKNQSSAPVSSHTLAPVKAVEPNCVTCDGTYSYQNCPATSGNVYRDNIQEYVSQAAVANYNHGNTSFRPQMVANQIRPPGFPPYQNNQNNFNRGNNFNQKRGGTEVTKDQVQTPSSQSTAPVQPPVVQPETQTLVSEPVVALVIVPMPNMKPSISYPSRHDNERRRDQANEQIKKFYEIFKDMSFEISFTDALILIPKFASTLKALIGNMEKLSEMARTTMNELCSAVILNKLPRKLGDLGKFLIPYEFPGMDECLALADLGASINLIPLSVWEGLSFLKLTPTCMTLELADRSVFKPIGITKDVSVKVGVFQFPADFVVVDFEPDPRVPLILERCFLKTGRALIDVHKGELTLRIRNKAITYNLDQTSRYFANYNQMKANKIDVICEMYSQEVLGFSDTTASGNPTPYNDPIVSTTSHTLTPFGDSDFLLFEEADAFLDLKDDPNSPEFNPFYYDPEGDIFLLEAILNNEPLPPLPNHDQYLPSYKKELKACEAKTVKSSVDEPPKVELKDLPPHLEYAFLEGDNKLPVIIAKELGDEDKFALIKKPAVQHQRGVNHKIHDIIKKEVEKLLDAGLIYPITDSPWVSPVHYVPKKGGFIVVENEENELIPTRLVTGWRVCIDYQKLNEATHKGHFPLPFMDQMLERLARNEYYCFLDGFFRCMLAIFNDMVEKTMEVFMDDFSVFENSFENCLSRLDKMLQMCEDTNLSLNWEKSHFMVKEGIVLGHKISKNEIEVDKAKVDVIAKLPHPTTVKGTLPDNTITNPKEELKVAPDGASIPNLKPSIPYPSRRDNEKRRDQANEQIKKFYEIFKDMNFKISFTDALTLMPKFASTLKALIGNKEKLNEMARTLMNEHYSEVILNKLPRKLGDPIKFLIPCEFPGMDECLALANLGASINLMPFFVWEALSLPEFTPTCMTLELADRLVSKPIGIAKDVSFKVGVFQFPADFVVVDFEPDPRAPLILGRCFLKTGRALIDVHKEVLGFSNVTASGSPTPDDDLIVSTTSPTLTSFGDSDFLLFEEADAFLGLEDDPDSPKINPFYYNPEGDILLLEAILNSEPLPPLPNHEQYLPSYKKELKAFLEGNNKFPVIIAKELGDEEKSALIKTVSLGIFKFPLTLMIKKDKFTCPYGMFAYLRMPFGLGNALGNFQRCMLAIFHDMVEKTMEVFMDDFSVFGNSFENYLSRLDKMLQRCEDTNQSLNWEKSHFMVKEGIVLGHKISKNGIKVDKAKIDVITKLPHPTKVKEKTYEGSNLDCPKLGPAIRAYVRCKRFRHRPVPVFTREKYNLVAVDYLSKWVETKALPTNDARVICKFLKSLFAKFGSPRAIISDRGTHFCNDQFAKDCPDCEVSRALSFCLSFTRASHPQLHFGNPNYLSKWVEAKALPTNDAQFVCKFLKSLFARFGAPRAIISDRGTHFCNDQFAKVMLKYGVTHLLSIAYHPQTSGQVKIVKPFVLSSFCLSFTRASHPQLHFGNS
nr:reverse transcriptase domain-containing protein [Tanacetum cinerariifolium]